MAMPDNSRNRGRDYGRRNGRGYIGRISNCLLYTSDAADE